MIMLSRHTKFYFVRHGATNWNIDMLKMGPIDYGLNHIGQAQSNLTAIVLKQLLNVYNNKAIIISSTLLRAKETSNIISKMLGAPIIFHSLLEERYYGDYSKNKTDIPIDEEDFTMFQLRAKHALSDIIATQELLEGMTTIVVSHSGVFQSFLKELNIAEQKIAYGGVAEFQLNGDNCMQFLGTN